MKLYRLLIHTDRIRYPYPVVLQGAFYALLDWIDPQMAQQIHDHSGHKLSIFWNPVQSHLEVGMCGEEWKTAFPLQDLKGIDWRFGEETVRIHQIRMHEVSDPIQLHSVNLEFLSPVLLRDANRKAVLNPSLKQILSSACKKADLKLDLTPSEKLRCQSRLERVFSDYKYQKEPAFMGSMQIDGSKLMPSEQQELLPAFQALNVLGCGAKTMMGFGRVLVSS